MAFHEPLSFKSVIEVSRKVTAPIITYSKTAELAAVEAAEVAALKVEKARAAKVVVGEGL